MLKLATPISSLFNNAKVGKIISESDFLECRDYSLNHNYPKQRLMHFDLNIIHGWRPKEKAHIYSVIHSKRGLKLITFHMDTSCKNPVIKNGMYYLRGLRYSRKKLLSNARNNAAWIRAFVGKNILVGVENNNYYPTAAYRYVTEGNFISQIVKENDLYFLFDIAHARITAHNRRMPYEDYRATLPLERTIQLHISQPGINKKNIAYDAHGLPDESLFQETAEITRKFPVKYLTIEYYKDAERLLGVLSKYKKLKSCL